MRELSVKSAEVAMRVVLRRAVRSQRTDVDRRLAELVEQRQHAACVGSTIDKTTAIERLASLWAGSPVGKVLGEKRVCRT
ncbi:hypothetical protein [Planctomicrobium sp. SH664]|uniref:hypothetical protein n=1 Tax=Planctomicrobium sp. SH664 TaxID=3448125 RepID=UPI003F5B645E